MSVAQIFKALGDPIRLEIVTRLSKGTDLTINDISKNLGVTRQGARKQLQVLVSAKIVQLRPEGRETKVSLDSSRLEIAQAFIAKLEKQWDQRLQALKKFTEQ